MKKSFLLTDRGNPAKDQVTLYDKETMLMAFYSYNTEIAQISFNGNKGELIQLTNYYDYSRTTSKYLYKFINTYTDHDIRNKKDLEKFIKDNNITIIKI